MIKKYNGMIILGLGFGDEAKARVIDYCSKEADMVVRSSAGANCGHSIIVANQKFIFNLVPSGVLRPNVVCVMGNGMAIDPFALCDEIKALQEKGIDFKDRFFISNLAQLVMPYHIQVDKERESNLTGTKIGTTLKGIGPFYEDLHGRRGVRFCDLFTERAAEVIIKADQHWKTNIDRFKLLNDLAEVKETLKPYLTDTSKLVNDALDRGENVVFEGAQGSLLDVSSGTVPYVTSSFTIAGGACIGAGVGPTKISQVLGVAKCGYVTKVGEGPFSTEIFGELADYFRITGKEFGSVTGRPRRIGWMDLPAMKYAARLNGISALVLTKADILSGIKIISYCTKYIHKQTKETVFDYSPIYDGNLIPVFEEIAGWDENLSDIKNAEDLPKQLHKLIKIIEDFVGVPVAMLSVGAERDSMITLNNNFGFNSK